MAIVHDFLMQMGGGEKVLEVLHEMYPEAPIYTSAYDPEVMPAYYRTWDIRTSFLQGMPYKQKTHRLALLLYPLAFETFDFAEYDLVISSSSAFAKGIITQPHTHHVCYTHAPMRYAWASRAYMQNEKVGKFRALLFPGLHYLRTWDVIAAQRVDTYVANSTAVARRIAKFYRRECDIVCPPVETDRFEISAEVDDYYLIVSRFVPYKRLDLAVEALTALGRPLKIVGEGRQRRALEAIAGKNVEFLGRVDDVELPRLIARAKAFLMPGEEDFGIAPVEANACGRPVIAYARGGALDSQIEGVTGTLFQEQTVAAMCEAICRADEIEFDPATIRRNADRFNTRVFKTQLAEIIAREMRGDRALVETPSLPSRLVAR